VVTYINRNTSEQSDLLPVRPANSVSTKDRSCGNLLAGQAYRTPQRSHISVSLVAGESQSTHWHFFSQKYHV